MKRLREIHVQEFMKLGFEMHIQLFTGYIKGGFFWFIEDNLGTHAIGNDIHEMFHNYETAVSAEGVMP